MLRRVASVLLILAVVLVAGCGPRVMPQLDGKIQSSKVWLCEGKALRSDIYDTPWKAIYVGTIDNGANVKWDANPWLVIRYDKDDNYQESWISWHADGRVDWHGKGNAQALYTAFGGGEQTICQLAANVYAHRK